MPTSTATAVQTKVVTVLTLHRHGSGRTQLIATAGLCGDGDRRHDVTRALPGLVTADTRLYVAGERITAGVYLIHEEDGAVALQLQDLETTGDPDDHLSLETSAYGWVAELSISGVRPVTTP